MLNLIILLLILVILLVHRYLSSYWEQGTLPYSMGFLLFANFFIFLYLINFIWMFGFLLGIIITILAMSQIIFATLLWPFMIPKLMKLNSSSYSEILRVNPSIYSSFPFLIIVLIVLTILNFFLSIYGQLSESIFRVFDNNIFALVLSIFIFVLVSNFLRIYVLSKFMGNTTDDKKNKTKEIDEALSILGEAEDKFGPSFSLVRKYVEDSIFADKKQFIDVVKQGRSVRKYVYSMIANVSGDMVESGHYHLHRGVLNPMGPGKELLDIFDSAMDELVRLGDTDKDNSEKQKKAIRKNIENVG